MEPFGGGRTLPGRHRAPWGLLTWVDSLLAQERRELWEEALSGAPYIEDDDHWAWADEDLWAWVSVLFRVWRGRVRSWHNRRQDPWCGRSVVISHVWTGLGCMALVIALRVTRC